MNQSLPYQLIRFSFLAITLIIFGVFGFHYLTGIPPILMTIAGMLIGGIAFFLSQFIIHFLLKWLHKVPITFLAILLSMIFTLWFAKWMGFGMPNFVYYRAALILILLSLLAAICFDNRKRIHWMISSLGIISPFLFMAWGIYWLLQEGKDPYAKDLRPPYIPENITQLSTLGLTNPANPGSFSFEHFTYGSGDDKQRKEYESEVRFKTSTVDASLLLPEWKGKKKKWRERYWGFGVKKFPINGRVHLPQGSGPFPIVLMVHGNHSMIDYSDGGYAYLGELLASRGMIAVSVDENFINGHWSGDFRGREMPTRAWLLLKHLEQWNNWNKSPEHELFGKVNMDQIMLIGHSRGGEAVSIAAAFNKLPYYPDNAKLAFDFNFGIKGIVSIAPTDYRYHRQIKLENVNYLSLQGAYDADETSFWGMRPFRRLKFTDDKEWFKAGVYIHKANHGQFNSTWGRADFGAPGKWFLNTQPLIKGEDQREVAKVFISAFAEAALKKNNEYLSLFSNVNYGRNWLPDNYYLTHFQDNRDSIFQNFEEDIHLAKGRNNIKISTANLKIWREENLGTRGGGSQENNAVVLGWDYGKELNSDSLASYTLQFPDSTLLKLDSTDQLLISLASGNYKSLDKFRAKKKEQSSSENKEPKRKEPFLDFHLVLKDSSGGIAKLKLRNIKEIAPPLKVQFMKLKSYGEKRIGKPWEVHLESFALPLNTFEQANNFNLMEIQEIQLVFDVCPYGVIVVDELGVSR